MSDQFSLNLLGGFAVYRGDRPVELPPACQRLVALVALKRRPVHRLWVCAELWPHTQTRRAVASLRSALWRLRPAGADALLIVDPQYLALAPGVSVDVHDATERIERLLDRGEPADPHLVADLLPRLRAGELLDAWAEPWTAHERDRYHALRMAALDALAAGPEKQVPHHARRPRHPLPTVHTVTKANNESSEP